MSKQRVLVVDDEPQILRALQTNLRGAGYEVETAATAEAALAAAAAYPPDAVILDLVLPDGRGTDVCRQLREWSSIPIVVLSAVGDEQEKVAALDAGADDYVTKPFGMDELLARLRAALRRAVPSGEPVLEIGELTVDLEKHAVFFAGEPVSLHDVPFDLVSDVSAPPSGNVGFAPRIAIHLVALSRIGSSSWPWRLRPGEALRLRSLDQQVQRSLDYGCQIAAWIGMT